MPLKCGKGGLCSAVIEEDKIFQKEVCTIEPEFFHAHLLILLLLNLIFIFCRWFSCINRYLGEALKSPKEKNLFNYLILSLQLLVVLFPKVLYPFLLPSRKMHAPHYKSLKCRVI